MPVFFTKTSKSRMLFYLGVPRNRNNRSVMDYLPDSFNRCVKLINVPWDNFTSPRVPCKVVGNKYNLFYLLVIKMFFCRFEDLEVPSDLDEFIKITTSCTRLREIYFADSTIYESIW